MVTVKLYGRLGNQLFQIAASKSFAWQNNLDCYIPPHSEDPSKWPSYFPHLSSSPPQSNNFFDYKEPAGGYHPIPYYPNIKLDGYFQSEKYFSMCRQPLIKLLNIPWHPKSGYVSIHVRRGDYLNHSDKHPVVTEEYLTMAIEYFIERGYSKFIMFSDDIAWCRNFIQHNGVGHRMKRIEYGFSEGKTELEDISLMSGCEHHIISNSSFSWWAAYLNQNPNKIVIAPKVWTKVSPQEWDTKDIVPETWIKM
jgi:hypothetical protein